MKTILVLAMTCLLIGFANSTVQTTESSSSTHTVVNTNSAGGSLLFTTNSASTNRLYQSRTYMTNNWNQPPTFSTNRLFEQSQTTTSNNTSSTIYGH